MVSSVNNFINNYNDRYEIKNKNQDADKSSYNKPLTLQGNGAILSNIHVQTGESIGIYYDEEAGGNRMIARVESSDGAVKEIKIDPDKVDPSNASYVEMLAVSANLKQQGKIDSPAGGIVAVTLARRVAEANARQGEIFRKWNFVNAMQEQLADCLKCGMMDSYLIYQKEISMYANMVKGSSK